MPVSPAFAKSNRLRKERLSKLVGRLDAGMLAVRLPNGRLLGVTDKKDGLEGSGGNPDRSSRVQAVVSFFGRTNFTRKTWSNELEEKIFIPLIGASFDDKPELYKRISPIAYVSRTSPPFLFVHGAEDKLVPPQDSTDMATKLRAAGVSAKAVIVEGVGHGWWEGEKQTKSIEQAVAFFDKHLKK